MLLAWASPFKANVIVLCVYVCVCIYILVYTDIYVHMYAFDLMNVVYSTHNNVFPYVIM